MDLSEADMSKFSQEEEELLKLFQSEANRRAEEEFARIFTEKDNVRVAFINEDRAFTDGRNIVVDPASDKLFSDREAIEKTLKFLGLPENSCSSWSALKLISRRYFVQINYITNCCRFSQTTRMSYKTATKGNESPKKAKKVV